MRRCAWPLSATVAASAAATCLVAALAPSSAAAHPRPLSYSFLHAHDDRVDVRIQLAPADLALFALPPALTRAQRAQLGQRLQRELRISARGSPCSALAAAATADAAPPWQAWSWSVRCAERDGERSVHAGFDALFQNGHRHLVRYEHAGQRVERVFELGAADWTIAPGAGASGSRLLDYVALGVEHMLTGWDHLAFVLALLLLATRLREVVVLVTSFTLAHSLTLALAVLRVLQPHPVPVEALIGFSIALLGLENCWLLAGRGRSLPAIITLALLALAAFGGGALSRSALAGLALFCACHFALLARAREPAGLRVAIAFAFGLIHGLGFAAIMAELDLPRGRVASALLGFNAGIELGQLAVVLLAWPLLRALARLRDGRPARLLTEIGSAAVVGLGLFWFVTRAFS